MSAASPASLLDFLATVPDPRCARPTSPAGRHARGRLLRDPVRRSRVQADRPMASRPGHRPGARPGLYPQAAQVGGIPQAVHRVGPDTLRGRIGAVGGGRPGQLALWGRGRRRAEPVALDGKAVRGSIGRHEGAVHLLSLMAQRYGLTLRQTEVGSKTNEHKAAMGLLQGLVLEGRVVTGDAMFCQRDLCAGGQGRRALLRHGKRQPARTPARHRRRVQPGRGRGFFPLASVERTARQFTEHRTLDQHGDRIESRRLRATNLLNGYLDWPFVGQICEVERVIKRRGEKPSREAAYAITSVTESKANAATLLG